MTFYSNLSKNYNIFKQTLFQHNANTVWNYMEFFLYEHYDNKILHIQH